MPKFIKGFKLDDEKIQNYLPRQPFDTRPDWAINCYEFIIDRIPRDAYIGIGVGFEANGDVICVIMLEKGDDKEKLEEEPVHTDDEMLAQIAKDVMTPGVWLSL